MGNQIVSLALGKHDDADSGDEEQDAEDLELKIVLGEEGVTDQVDIGELAGS